MMEFVIDAMGASSARAWLVHTPLCEMTDDHGAHTHHRLGVEVFCSVPRGLPSTRVQYPPPITFIARIELATQEPKATTFVVHTYTRRNTNQPWRPKTTGKRLPRPWISSINDRMQVGRIIIPRSMSALGVDASCLCTVSLTSPFSLSLSLSYVSIRHVHMHAEPFREPVAYKELGLLDYPTIIQKPMDLGTVKKKLKERQYASPADVNADVQLVWSNCMTYNQVSRFDTNVWVCVCVRA